MAVIDAVNGVDIVEDGLVRQRVNKALEMIMLTSVQILERWQQLSAPVQI